ncbi:nuclear transport factor 2 (NTF2) family protein / RNA recognition motif (RRM)-containing protein [Raphanus sativus]|uniref:Ninja-family protein n=1 Tax=Raphanus sativus TaxID=3726 RepID=A0A9W3BYB1_RAPSA|nr:ninja-family protein AFP3-like [Raphanus sativus]KAJ4886036.1 nuclear transport factor 2 (NTF2) family protein / RNA recognition motif (RRM)-containing protein [Raphanus sativus]
MAKNLGKEEDAEVELELCLSLGGPFKKAEKAQPLEFRTHRKPNTIRCVEDDVDLNDRMVKHENSATRKKLEAEQQISGGEGECKRIKTEHKEVTNGAEFDLSFSGLGNRYGSGQYKVISKPAAVGSPIRSSSDVSDPSSSSRQEGESCELGVNSGQTKPIKSPVNNILTGTTDGSNDVVVVETRQGSNSVVKETGKPPKPRSNGNKVNGSMLPFAQMPCVTSTGNGPEGKTVNGFLYRYSNSEVTIICVCHGTSFSPAEFIIHAGGTHVSHPLRHITVVPSKF